MTAENIVDALVVYQATLSAEQIAALRRIIRLVQQDERERIAEKVRNLDDYHGWTMDPPNAQRWINRAAVLAIMEERE